MKIAFSTFGRTVLGLVLVSGLMNCAPRATTDSKALERSEVFAVRAPAPTNEILLDADDVESLSLVPKSKPGIDQYATIKRKSKNGRLVIERVVESDERRQMQVVLILSKAASQKVDAYNQANPKRPLSVTLGSEVLAVLGQEQRPVPGAELRFSMRGADNVDTESYFNRLLKSLESPRLQTL